MGLHPESIYSLANGWAYIRVLYPGGHKTGGALKWDFTVKDKQNTGRVATKVFYWPPILFGLK